MRVIREILAVIQLTRLGEYVGVVTAATALGLFVVPANHTLSLLPVTALFIMNMLNFAFSFMINDIEDADNDSLDTAKVNRNPVSARRIGKRNAYLSTLIVGVISTCIAYSLGWQVFSINTLALTLGFLYSWRNVRLKSYPIVDFISHALFLGTLQFLSAVFIATPTPPMFLTLWGAISVFGISVIGDLRNELRDFAVDRKVGLTNTAQVFRLDKYEQYFTHIEIVPIIGCILYFFAVIPTSAVPIVFACGIGVLAGYLAMRLLHFPLRITHSHQEIVLTVIGGIFIVWHLIS